MAENTSIEWCEHTWSPWEGCQKVGDGCTNCYAEARNQRFAGGANWGPGAPRRKTAAASWKKPLQWAREAEAAGTSPRVFPSLCDPFDNAVDVQWRHEFFDLILATRELTWLLLTKRIGNVQGMIPAWLHGRLPDNVWLGATVVNQAEADRDIPKLLAVPARVRFLSIEPMLGPVDLTAIKHTASPGFFGDCLEWYHRPHDERYTKWPGIDWVIVGAESGTQARPAHVEWVRNVVRQCNAAGTPVLVKQLGRNVLDDGMSSPGGHWPRGKVREPIPRATENDPCFVVRLKQAKGNDPEEWPEDLRVREFPLPRAS